MEYTWRYHPHRGIPVKQQKINKATPKKQPRILDFQTPPPGKAIRTVIFVEMGAMTPEQFAMLAAKVRMEYAGATHGDHYFCPVRTGQISADPYFENEFMDIVNKVCEIRDGTIVLKGDITPVKVTRVFVDGSNSPPDA